MFVGFFYLVVVRLIVRVLCLGGFRFLFIERLDYRFFYIGDIFRLNLRVVGVSAFSFFYYYYMVCMSWVVEESRGVGRGLGRKEFLCGGMVLGLGCVVK